LLDDPDLVVVHCITPHLMEEATPASAAVEPGAVEPELIRKEKAAEDEAEEK
jgi:hypothetical protein